jgi:ubiquinone/menaquinone biosynthesis C-methylase UbiE
VKNNDSLGFTVESRNSPRELPEKHISCDESKRVRSGSEGFIVHNNNNLNNVQSFERRSSTYEHSFFQRLFFDRIHQTALNLIPGEFNPENILDIGCGTGRLLRKASVRWPAARLTGVDPAEGMIREARRLTPGAVFYVSMAESLALPEASFDLAMSTMSFHHWQNQAQGVCQVARVLRPAGYFLLADLLEPFWPLRIFMHGRQASPAAVKEWFTQAGLKILAQQFRIGLRLLVTLGQRN